MTPEKKDLFLADLMLADPERERVSSPCVDILSFGTGPAMVGLLVRTREGNPGAMRALSMLIPSTSARELSAMLLRLADESETL